LEKGNTLEDLSLSSSKIRGDEEGVLLEGGFGHVWILDVTITISLKM